MCLYLSLQFADDAEEAVEDANNALDQPGDQHGDTLILDSRPASRSEENSLLIPPINPVLQQLLEEDQQERAALGVEEIFDILPLYGTLKVKCGSHGKDVRFIVCI